MNRFHQIHTFSLLLSVLVLISTDQVSCDTFYIVTESGNYCPEEYLSTSPPGQNCLTLSEFARNVDRQLLDPENLILTLESGLHSLDSSLVLPSNLSSLTISPANVSSITVPNILCTTNDTQFLISTVEDLLIRGIRFSLCYANKVEFVTTFRLEDFSFSSSTLNLEYVSNASIVRGSFNTNQGVNTTLYVYKSTLFLQGTDFLHNKGNIVGALQLIDSDAVVDRCTFLKNQVQNFQYGPNPNVNCGGAIFASASAFREMGKKNLTVIGSNFTENEATDSLYASRLPGNYVGGAVCSKDYASLVISNCSFEGNRARKNGGAISVTLSGPKTVVHIDTSQFTNNTLSNLFDAEADGSGALYIDGPDVHIRIDQSNFTRNTGGVKVVAGVSIFNCTQSEFTSNKGRGVYITQQRASRTSLVSIEQCNFTGNFDRSLNSFLNREVGGGAVTIQAPSSFPGYSYTVLINGSSFNKNYANFSGGAVKVIALGSDEAHVSVHVHNSSFVNNTNNYDGLNVDNFGQGGAMSINVTGPSSSVSISYSAFIDNKCASYRSFSPILKGGALALTADTIILNETGFIHNEANVGGALYINRANELLITESNFEDNIVRTPEDYRMPVSAGALFVDTNTNFTTIERSVFQNNTASKCGAIDFNHGAYHGNNELSISESYFESNRATESEGGVICISRGVVSISNTSFIGNSAKTNGGVIFAQNTILAMTASTFVNSSAEMDGGVLYGSGEYSLSECIFYENRALGNGGAAFLNGGQAQISDSGFIFNYASSGGALSLSSFRFEIQHVLFYIDIAVGFYGNIAEVNGGVISACTSATVLPDELSSLLSIRTDPQYEDNFCIYYDELSPVFPTQNFTNDTSIPPMSANESFISYETDFHLDIYPSDINQSNYSISLQYYAEYNNYEASLNLELELLNYDDEDHMFSLNSTDLHIRYKGNVNLIGNNGTVICYNESQIYINTIINVTITDVIFVGCEVSIGSVTNLMLQNVTFLSQRGLNNILRLDNIDSAIISDSDFIGRAGCCNIWPSHHIIANDIQELLVTHCTFLKNWGGCIYSDEVHLRVEHCNFTDNTNYPTNDPWGRGGAISARHFNPADHIPGGDSVSITDSTFTGNSAGYGGAVYVHGIDTPVWISQSTFTRNRANLYFGGAVDIHTGSYVFISENSFNMNTANYDGGALYSESPALTIERSDFTGNTVTFRDGGAVRALNSLSVSESVFISNKAGSKGGAIYFNASSDVLVSVNQSGFANNTLTCQTVPGTHGDLTTCGDNGAALYFRVGAENSVVISQSVFVGNAAEDPSIDKQDIYIIGTDLISYINTTSDSYTTTTEEASTSVPTTTAETTVAGVTTTQTEVSYASTESTTTNTLPTVTSPTISNGSNSTSQPSTVPSVPTSSSVNETNSTSTTGPVIVSPVASSGSNESTKTTETTSSNIPSTTESTSYETTTRFVPVVTAGSGRQVKKIVVPVVAVVGTIVLVAALVSVVVLVVYYLVRKHKRGSSSYDILSNKDSNSNVELLESDSPENRRKVGDNLDEYEEL